jgi:hypothetical protein
MGMGRWVGMREAHCKFTGEYLSGTVRGSRWVGKVSKAKKNLRSGLRKGKQKK